MSSSRLLWKKPNNKVLKRPQAFDEDDNSNELDSEDELPNVAKVARPALEDPDTRFRRLRSEGIQLAESERYWQAIKQFDQALELRPRDPQVLDMKAQSLIQLHEWDLAIDLSEKAVSEKPLWWEARQTLGRALIGVGRVKDARLAFAKAVHLKPDDNELVKEDLLWVQSLYKHVLAEEEAKKDTSEIDTWRQTTVVINDPLGQTRPTVSPVANIVITLFCFAKFWKLG